MSKKISFSTGDLVIAERSISFHQSGVGLKNGNTINRENIGHVDKQPLSILPKASIVLWIRLVLIGAVITIIGFAIAFSSKFFLILYAGYIILFGSCFMFFYDIFLEDVIGIPLSKTLLHSLFGVDAVKVVVQNIYGGNNLVFTVRHDEERKLPKFESLKLNKVYAVNDVSGKNAKSGNISDIEKLAALREKGLITEEEFLKKKKQILGL